MLLTKKLFSKLQKQPILDQEKLFWIGLHLEEEETGDDGFFFFKYEEWQERTGLSEPTITRYLKNLENCGLIIRDHRPLSANSPYPINGGSTFLFIKVCKPETDKDMTFFGKFLRIEYNSPCGEKLAFFKDVYNQTGVIRFQYAHCELAENDANSRVLKNINKNQKVVFEGRIQRDLLGRHPFIVNIWNIRPAEAFYANRRD